MRQFLVLVFLFTTYLVTSQSTINARWQLQDGTREKGVFYKVKSDIYATVVRVKRYDETRNTFEERPLHYDFDQIQWLRYRGDTIIQAYQWRGNSRPMQVVYRDSISLVKYPLPLGRGAQYLLLVNGQLHPFSSRDQQQEAPTVLSLNCSLILMPAAATRDHEMIWLAKQLNSCYQTGQNQYQLENRRHNWSFNGWMGLGLLDTRTSSLQKRVQQITPGIGYRYQPFATFSYLQLGIKSSFYWRREKFNESLGERRGEYQEHLTLAHVYLYPGVHLRFPFSYHGQLFVEASVLTMLPIHYRHRFQFSNPDYSWPNYPIIYDERSQRKVRFGSSYALGVRQRIGHKVWIEASVQRDDVDMPWPNSHRHDLVLAENQPVLIPTERYLLQLQVQRWW